MSDQPQYDVEQALKDCLEDMAKLRKQMSRNLPAQAVPPLAEALVKLRGEALRYLFLQKGDPTTNLLAEVHAAIEEEGKTPPGSPPVDDPGEPGETMPPEAGMPDPDAGEGGAE